MDEVYYVKRGKRYKAVGYYDSTVMDSFPKGSTLVVVDGNCTSRRYDVDPAFAPLIAAGMYAENKMTDAFMEASTARPTTSPITQEQADAWDAFRVAMGEEMRMINYPSGSEIVRAGVRAMRKEAEATMKVPAVLAAYEQFLMLYKLCKEQEND
jgi:hypothetical protein